MPDIDERIKDFLTTLKGRYSISAKEADLMYELYNEKFNKKEVNTGCDLCAVNIYTKLKRI